MTVTKLWEVIQQELDRLETKGICPHRHKHLVMIALEPKLFDKVIDRILAKTGWTAPELRQKAKDSTDQIQYLDYVIVKQKKELKDNE